MRAGYHDLLGLAIEHRRFRRGLPGIRAALLPPGALSRTQFLPAGGRRPDSVACTRARGYAHRGNGRRFGDVEKTIRGIIPPAETGVIVDNIGTYLSSINTIYNNTGTIGESDGDIQISLNQGHAPTAMYVAAFVTSCRGAFRDSPSRFCRRTS